MSASTAMPEANKILINHAFQVRERLYKPAKGDPNQELWGQLHSNSQAQLQPLDKQLLFRLSFLD